MSELPSSDWRQRFADTAELLPGIICEIDLDFRITYVNQAAYDLAGYTSADFESFEDLEKAYLQSVLAETPNKSEAAKRLGLHRSTLHRKLRALGLEEEYPSPRRAWLC